MVRAKRRASSVFFMKAPSPTVVPKGIRTRQFSCSWRSCNQRNGVHCRCHITQSIQSLSAFTELVGLTNDRWPISLRLLDKILLESFQSRKPLMDSNLSMVPPVWLSHNHSFSSQHTKTFTTKAQDQGHLVSISTSRVFVHHDPWDRDRSSFLPYLDHLHSHMKFLLSSSLK